MGRTTSKKMIPLLLLRILWIHADKDHMISMEYICDRLEDEFESERRMGRPALRKLCLLYTSPSPRDVEESRMPSSA